MLITPQEQIYQILTQNKRISNKELSQFLNLSLPTVRKLVDILVSQNKATPIYGGIKLNENFFSETSLFTENMHQIAQEAITLIQDGDSIFLGPGKTVATLCQYLHKFKDLTVVTNSLYSIEALSQTKNITIIVIGGIYQPSNRCFSLLAQEQVPNVNISKIFISGTGINSKKGVYHSIPANCYTEEIFASQAQEVILLADVSKFGVEKPFVVMSMEYIDYVITTRDLDPRYVEDFQKQNIKVILA